MSASPRWIALDVARGLAVVAMILFHLIWDLSHFGYIEPNLPWSAPVKAFGHTIAFSFLFIAGLSLTLAHGHGVRWRLFWRRLALIAGAAALVSGGTYLVFPGAFVFFGILHCIAVASVIALPFLVWPWPLSLLGAAVFFAGPALFASPLFGGPYLQWLGLSTSEPLTQDWRPIFPWAGALLLGVAAGKLPFAMFGERAKARAGADAPLRAKPLQMGLAFLGRHSLLVYLAHQPLIFGLIAALASVAPPPDENASFIPACEKRCAEDGGAAEQCRAICICVAREVVATNSLAGAQDDAERGRRIHAVALGCARKGQDR